MKKDIDERLQALRSAIEHARSMPMSASAVINRAEITGLLDDLEAAIDSTLTHATELVGDRDAVVAEGHSAAQEIIRQAQADREKLVSDTDVYRLAQERADELLASAKTDAEALVGETDEYVESSLANFELTLEKTLAEVRRGRARLTGGHSHALGDDSDVDDIELPEHQRRRH